MQSHIYDVIVIGAGGMGSATTYHLTKAGVDVLLLEQFQRGHSFGSSHGETRIIRFFYDKPFYTELMKTAYTEWRSLESESGKQLLFITGSINIGENGNQYIDSVRQSLDASDVESEWWDSKRVTDKFPQFRVSNDMKVLWQKDTGFLYASECVLTHLQLAENNGAKIHENTRVTHIEWQNGGLIVHTDDTRFFCRKVVVTAGAWTSNLLNELNTHLKVTKQQVCYFQPSNYTLFQPNRFPVFTEITTENEFLYGIPYFGKHGVKVARHGMGKIVSPDSCDRKPDSDYIERMDTYLRERIPDIGKTTHSEVCLYTETPEEDFIIDKHPDCPDILIAAGFSGHGFKFCSLVGRIMSEMALTGETTFDIHPFHLSRLM